MQGWISLHRKVMENPLFTEKRVFSRFEAWVDILMMVNHEDSKFLLGSEMVEVKRGQRITSIRQLCERWSWSNTKVRKFLELLESEEMVTVKSDTKKTVLTVDKYDFYQHNDLTKTPQKRHGNDTETTQKHTNNNVNNDSTMKNNDYIKDIVDYLNEVCGTSFKSTTKATQQLINARFKEKFKIDDFKAVIDAKQKEWGKDAKMKEYLRPQTLFGTKFESYLQNASRSSYKPKTVERDLTLDEQVEMIYG